MEKRNRRRPEKGERDLLYIGICDSHSDCEKLSDMIRDFSDRTGILCSVKTFQSGEDLLDYMDTPCPFHIIFMEVMLKTRNGIDTALELRRKQYQNHIVFVSKNPEYALDSYMVKAYNYLLKPLKNAELTQILTSIWEDLQTKDTAILPINTKSGIYMIRHRDILYMESHNHNLLLHCRNSETLSFSGKLDNLCLDFSSALLCGFLRCHKSYLVNCDYIRKIGTSCFHLTDGTQVPISRSYKNAAIHSYLNYLNLWPETPAPSQDPSGPA